MTEQTLTEAAFPPPLRYEELCLLQDRILRQVPEKERLTPVQVSVLRRVAETTPCSQAQLTSQTLSRTAVSAIVSLLIDRRLLKRSFDEQDARKHLLFIKDKGRQLLSKFDQITQEEIIALRPANQEA